jgi:hypothetical protein
MVEAVEDRKAFGVRFDLMEAVPEEFHDQDGIRHGSMILGFYQIKTPAGFFERIGRQVRENFAGQVDLIEDSIPRQFDFGIDRLMVDKSDIKQGILSQKNTLPSREKLNEARQHFCDLRHVGDHIIGYVMDTDGDFGDFFSGINQFGEPFEDLSPEVKLQGRDFDNFALRGRQSGGFGVKSYKYAVAINHGGQDMTISDYSQLPQRNFLK